MPRMFTHIRGAHEAPDNQITVSVACPRCDVIQDVRVGKDDYAAYRNGESHIQVLFPYLTSDEREVLQTGTCPTCWDAMFGDE